MMSARIADTLLQGHERQYCSNFLSSAFGFAELGFWVKDLF